MKKVTMRDIGKVVGVSAVTVSKAMAGESGVSEAMRQKILQVAAEMGYVNPNAAKHQEKKGLDIGPRTVERYRSVILTAGTLLWKVEESPMPRRPW